ncbi:hypothetical protein I5M32_08370 [Pedobacter sp. SD-b]|uniref:Uncharacterized protein n=1 Tax=Pedobacter segetis TaxID=2793069 RepID=A0ABS1BJH4_9SPHI|nr:hypothetical protein [Pedobacter segetis]MBK0382973.1 hypothetical protein [Pedobacter segetis]
MQKINKLLIVSFLLFGCNAGSKKAEIRQIYYFDLKSYFQNLADSLNKTNTIIEKTVAKNGVKETKKIKVADWKNEFALFIDADINKSAWQDSYIKDSTATKISYKAKNKSLKTQSITIGLEKGKAKKIIVKTKADNLLYQGEETLTYTNGVSYQIKKHQKVIFLGLNDYLIEGRFKNK